MPTVLITTDFSAASRHALDYACALLHDKPVTLDLLHVFTIPVTYTTDGVAIVAMGNAIEQAGNLMQDEVERVRHAYPGIRIEGRVIAGSFLETLQQEARLTHALFMILGTAGFGDIYLGDADPLEALRSIPVPVLFIPLGAAFHPIRNIAFACNYAHTGPETPVQGIVDWVRFMDAALDVVHTDAEPQGFNEQQATGEQWLKARLSLLNPRYHWIQDADVIRGLSSFLSSGGFDCLMVVPRRYGIWQNMFHRSRTKALARLNRIPIIAFHRRER